MFRKSTGIISGTTKALHSLVLASAVGLLVSGVAWGQETTDSAAAEEGLSTTPIAAISATPLKAFDSTGVEIGPLVGDSRVLFESSDGVFFAVNVSRSRFEVAGTNFGILEIVWFTETGCTGTAFVAADPFSLQPQPLPEIARVAPDPALGLLSALIRENPDADPVPLTANSMFGPDMSGTLSCNDAPFVFMGPGNVLVPIVDLSGFIPPFTTGM